ncbi:neuromedin-U receptor 2-like isoform X2 [Aricia agestis]|uniref:neuromedin-U receptor 2-like isoform X2 n=1 Tax=Aricia agestis TaxID=91739 RepID=UPI001C205DCB|nr:neuromedin-U receptor 2-like isoform X2 [Aricia agestis]
MNSTGAYKEYDEVIWSQFLEKVNINDPTLVLIVAKCTIFIVSLVGNLLTCIVIYCDRTMHTATNYYLFNMAVSDLIVTFAILLEVDEYLSNSYQFGNLACKVHFFCIVVLWNNSILVMTVLAVERYIAIWYPMLLKTKVKRVMKVITALWVVAILETLPEIWGVELVKSKTVAICFTVPTPYSRIVNGIMAVVTFILPLGIMLFVYTMIALKINDTEKPSSNSAVFNHKRNRGRVNKLIVLTLSFLICWMPFFTFRVVIFAYDMHQQILLDELWRIGFQVMMITNWLSVVLNPIIFSLISTKFRKSLEMLWRKKIRKEPITEVRGNNVIWISYRNTKCTQV